jgi:hypothetical protein
MLTHLKRNAVAYAALFLALGGTSYAAVRLPAGSVGTKELHSGAVTKTKLHRGAVTSAVVQDHTLKAADFARGQLTAGPRGDAGPKGDKGDPGPTMGVAGKDAGCCEPLLLSGGEAVQATKTVTLATRSRLFVFANALATINGCSSPYCNFIWGVVVDGVPVAHSVRQVRVPNSQTASDSLTPFGVTAPLPPGEHSVSLVSATPTGNSSTSYADLELGAIALGV